MSLPFCCQLFARIAKIISAFACLPTKTPKSCVHGPIQVLVVYYRSHKHHVASAFISVFVCFVPTFDLSSPRPSRIVGVLFRTGKLDDSDSSQSHRSSSKDTAKLVSTQLKELSLDASCHIARDIMPDIQLVHMLPQPAAAADDCCRFAGGGGWPYIGD